jgi:flavin-dependent dehydrogenase
MQTHFDVLIAGGGPAGTTAGLVLARQGFSVCILEKDTHPRFHIGESILPRNMLLFKELGLDGEVAKLPHVPKYGAEFGFGNNFETRRFTFTDGLLPGMPVFNIERAHLDKMLIDQARAAGVVVHESTPVKEITRLAHGDVEVTTVLGSFTAKLLIDASGQGTLVGRHLNTRKGFTDPQLQKVSYFQHFEGVERLEGTASGHPSLFMCDEGWFWLIGLSPTKTSVGFVTRPNFTRTLNVKPQHLLSWAVQRCPVVRHRMRNAVGPAENMVLSDFSYRCRPYAGDGYFLSGDAACFLDPIFSTGVTMAMMSAKAGADLITKVLRNELSPAAARREYINFVETTSSPFWRLIRGYYKHSFRELFMNGKGPLQMQGAIISILAGQVFPKPAWALRWRHAAFDLCVFLQQYFTLAPHREPCHLLQEQPQSVAAFEALQPA